MIKEKCIKCILSAILIISLSGCSGGNLFNKDSDDEDAIIVSSHSKNAINFGIEGLDTFNPILTNSSTVFDCMQFVYEPLFSFDEGLNPVCVLADSCIASSDGMSYTIKLKDNILWHDQTPFKPVDVLHTINLIRYNQTRYANSLSCISSVSVADDNSLFIKLNRPVPNFTALLSFPIVQESVTAEVLRDFVPIGTGAYKYEGKITSDKIKLVPNENYRGGQPAIGQIHLNILKDKVACSNAFNAGEIDAITSVTMDFSKNTPRGEINTYDYISNNMVFMGINNQKSELSGKNTRKALSCLIDKQDIITTEIFSRAVEAKIPINPSAWYHPQIPSAKYDDEYITEVLALDNWMRNDEGVFTRNIQKYVDGIEEPVDVGQTLKINIIVNDNNEERYRVAKKIGDTFNAFGIETSITLVSFEDYKTRIGEKNYDVFLGEIKLSDNMDLYSLLCDKQNYFSYYLSSMHNLVYRMGLDNSSEEQKATYTEFANLFMDEMPFIPLFFNKESVIFERSISGVSKPTIFCSYPDIKNIYISQKITTQND